MLLVVPRLVILPDMLAHDGRVERPRQAALLADPEPARLAGRDANDEGQGDAREQDLHFPSLTETYGPQRKYYLREAYSRSCVLARPSASRCTRRKPSRITSSAFSGSA